MQTFVQTLVNTAAAVATFAADAKDYNALPDEQLLELGSAISAHERAFGLVKAQHAAQLARRSRHELGHSGLAARHGFASPAKFLQAVTKVTAREAAQLVSIGVAIAEADSVRELQESGVSEVAGTPVEVPWDAVISDAASSGAIGVDCADALRRGLGSPTETVTGRMLGTLAEQLILERSTLDPDRMFKAARIERELIDLDSVKATQQQLYIRGGLRLFPQPDGMWRLSGHVDPESAAILTTALDPYTSPRRGGPRFTTTDGILRAKAIVDDPRSTERLALDGLLELVKLGAGVDPTKMQPRLRALVKLVKVVTAVTTVERTQSDGTPMNIAAPGFGVIENSGDLVSAATIHRLLCDGDSIEMAFDESGKPLNLGRTSRLYDRRQREALAVRDGGCLWPECDRPPAFTEAHHTTHWNRDRGRTDIDDGVLLCRFHHLQLHNNHWEITRRGSEFWLTSPPAIDSGQTPVLLRTKSTLIEYLRRSAAG